MTHGRPVATVQKNLVLPFCSRVLCRISKELAFKELLGQTFLFPKW